MLAQSILLNDASIGCYVETPPSNTPAGYVSNEGNVVDSGGAQLTRAGTNMYVDLNNNSLNSISSANNFVTGNNLLMLQRTASNLKTLWIDGISRGTNAQASTLLISRQLAFGNSTQGGSNATFAMGFAGSSLRGKESDLASLWNKYIL